MSPISTYQFCRAVTFISLLTLSGCSVDDAQIATKVKDDTPLQQELVEMLVTYQENIVDAQEKFHGRKIATIGNVSGIELGWDDDFFIELSCENSDGNLHCFFADDQRQSVARIREGDQIKVIGVCTVEDNKFELRGCTLSPITNSEDADNKQPTDRPQN